MQPKRFRLTKILNLHKEIRHFQIDERTASGAPERADEQSENRLKVRL